MSYLGIDVGTSAVKAVLIDRDGTPIVEAEGRLTTDRRRPGWSEQDPDHWITTTTEVLRTSSPAPLPTPIGTSSPSAFPGRCTAPWCSVPTGAPAPGHSVERWSIRHGVPPPERSRAEPWIYRGRAGNARVHGAATALDPPQRAVRSRRIAHVLLPKDYLRLYLTGEYATDLCDGAGSLLVDEVTRDWHLPTLEAVGLPPSVLPRLLEGPTISGWLRPEAAAALGLNAGIPVAAGAGDAAAGAIGIGAVEDGDAFVSIGTSSQLFVTEAAYRPHPEALVHAFAHAVPERWFSMAAMLNGASPLAWLAGVIGGGDVGALIGRVEQARLPISPIMALPYLKGERTPHDDANARGVIFGIDGGTTAEHIAQAVMEGLAFTMMDADRVLTEAGVELDALCRRRWRRAVSPLGRNDRERARSPGDALRGRGRGPANGAARLARIVVTGNSVAIACPKPPVAEIVEPSPARRDAFAERYPEFRALLSSR